MCGWALVRGTLMFAWMCWCFGGQSFPLGLELAVAADLFHLHNIYSLPLYILNPFLSY